MSYTSGWRLQDLWASHLPALSLGHSERSIPEQRRALRVAIELFEWKPGESGQERDKGLVVFVLFCSVLVDSP